MPRNLLTAPGEVGEIRRLTILFADLVDWTVLSTQVEPETYRMLVGRYRERVVRVVDRFGAMSVRPMAMGCWWCWGTPAHGKRCMSRGAGWFGNHHEVAGLYEQARRRCGSYF